MGPCVYTYIYIIIIIYIYVFLRWKSSSSEDWVHVYIKFGCEVNDNIIFTYCVTGHNGLIKIQGSVNASRSHWCLCVFVSDGNLLWSLNMAAILVSLLAKLILIDVPVGLMAPPSTWTGPSTVAWLAWRVKRVNVLQQISPQVLHHFLILELRRKMVDSLLLSHVLSFRHD